MRLDFLVLMNCNEGYLGGCLEIKKNFYGMIFGGWERLRVEVIIVVSLNL